MGTRAESLAERIEQGARDLTAAVEALPEGAWGTECAGERRTVGILVHHVGASYLGERDIILAMLAGHDMSGLTWAVVDDANARHAREYASCTREEALELVRRTSVEAAAAIRGLSDDQLDRTVRTSLHWGAPLTVQYLIEQHPIAHPYIHLESIRAALGTCVGR